MRTATVRAICLILVAASAMPVAALGPQDTLRSFCRHDGLGDRLRARTWLNVAPLIGWSLEPAWDSVTLIDSYEVGDARFDAEGVASVEVTYQVASEVRAGAVLEEARVEKHVYRLVEDEELGWWRILAPPPRPHVFVNQVDRDVMASSLAVETGDFLTASAFVWKFLDGADWNVSLFATAGVPELTELWDVSEPEPGDIVVYYNGDDAYHVGILESADVVLSATLNGGIRRAPLDAFAGTVRYRRPRVAARKPTPEPTASAGTQDSPVPTPAVSN